MIFLIWHLGSFAFDSYLRPFQLDWIISLGYFEGFGSMLPSKPFFSKRKKILQLLSENICLPKIKKVKESIQVAFFRIFQIDERLEWGWAFSSFLKKGLQAERTTLWALMLWSSHARVISVKSLPFLRSSKATWARSWNSVHSTQSFPPVMIAVAVPSTNGWMRTKQI